LANTKNAIAKNTLVGNSNKYGIRLFTIFQSPDQAVSGASLVLGGIAGPYINYLGELTTKLGKFEGFQLKPLFCYACAMKTFFGRSWADWIAEYAESHQHPKNRLYHSLGIPMIVVSILLLIAGIFSATALWIGILLFLLGWIMQFVGHAYEGKPPEFFRDWRFLFVGLRWWVAKMKGKA
jgi:hypothetical protein|tara:strand:- start:95917 stop:96456 length:540 start_codon:yes stop_codon:yes gene_type:complete